MKPPATEKTKNTDPQPELLLDFARRQASEMEGGSKSPHPRLRTGKACRGHKPGEKCKSEEKK
jgi:hypothetical protein